MLLTTRDQHGLLLHRTPIPHRLRDRTRPVHVGDRSGVGRGSSSGIGFGEQSGGEHRAGPVSGREWPARRAFRRSCGCESGARGDEEAWAYFGAQAIPAFHTNGLHGWLDLPVDVAHERAAAINRWAVARGHHAHMASVDLHSHHHLGWRAGWQDPLGAGLIEVANCPILCVAWSPSELQRFKAGRPFGQVHPLTLEHVAGKAILRWSIPPGDTDA